MRLLEVPAADLLSRDVGGDGQHRHPAPVGVEQAVDEVEVARPAARRTDRKIAGDRRLSGGAEGRRLLVADMGPLKIAGTTKCVGEPVQ
jgi:hypothetical protein